MRGLRWLRALATVFVMTPESRFREMAVMLLTLITLIHVGIRASLGHSHHAQED
jgi:hypothetical protein